MLAVSFATQGFVAPTVHVQPVARANVQMMAPEMPSRRAALLSAASVLAVPFAAQAKPEDYAGGCAFSPRLFSMRTELALQPDFTSLAAALK
jgi:hypothetical protein